LKKGKRGYRFLENKKGNIYIIWYSMKRIASTATALLVWAVCMFVFTATSLSPDSGGLVLSGNLARAGFDPTDAFKTNLPKETFRGVSPCQRITLPLARERGAERPLCGRQGEYT
jgi:hypothetical protein